MVISCGAALYLARIAFTAEGWQTRVHRLPNPTQPDHLASLEFRRLSDVDANAVALAGVAAHRRTDRRPFLPDPVPQEVLTSLGEAAGAQGCTLRFALDDRPRRDVQIAIEHAGSVERDRPEYRQELAEWARRHAAVEGVPARSIPAEHVRGMPERDFGAGELPVPVLDDGAVLAVLATDGDTYESWLAAGEALGAVLLGAARNGLATCTLSQVSEVAAAREQVREAVLGGASEPQLVIRIGWPVTAEFPAPVTPRRPLAECVEELFPQG